MFKLVFPLFFVCSMSFASSIFTCTYDESKGADKIMIDFSDESNISFKFISTFLSFEKKGSFEIESITKKEIGENLSFWGNLEFETEFHSAVSTYSQYLGEKVSIKEEGFFLKGPDYFSLELAFFKGEQFDEYGVLFDMKHGQPRICKKVLE